MEYDLVARWTLGFFAACAAGGVIGLLAGWLTRFEVGLGVGLLVAGAFSLAYVPRFVWAYQELTRHPLRTAGVVVAVEDRATNAAGDVTSPVAVVEYAGSDGRTRRADSRAASGLAVGDAVIVVPRGRRATIGRPDRMRGGAIGALLFGTFPASTGVFLLAGALLGRRAAQAQERTGRAPAGRASRLTVAANLVLLGGFLGPIAWAARTDAPVMQTVMLAFGGVSLGLWLHVAEGIRSRRDATGVLGIAVLAVNFSVWVVALWLLGGAPDTGW